jgi:uncharacterized protein
MDESETMPNNNNGRGRGGTSRRGFAAMDENRQREIASLGGKAAHASGNAHEFTSEEAREAGRKGGRSRQRKGRGGGSNNGNNGGGNRGRGNQM